METSISGSCTWRDARWKSRAARSDGEITAFTIGRRIIGLLSFPVTRTSFRITSPCAERVGGLFLWCVNDNDRVHVQERGRDIVLTPQGDVFEVVRDVEVRDVHVEYGFQRLGERLCLSFERDRLAVHDRGEGRLDVPVDVIWKVRNERDGDMDPPDLVPGFLRAVVEVDAPVDEPVCY